GARRQQMTLCVGVQTKPSFGQSTFFANAGYDVLKHFALRIVIENIVCHNQWNRKGPGKSCDRSDPLPVIATAEMSNCEMKISAKQVGAAPDMRFCRGSKNLREGKNEIL